MNINTLYEQGYTNLVRYGSPGQAIRAANIIRSRAKANGSYNGNGLRILGNKLFIKSGLAETVERLQANGKITGRLVDILI